MRFLVAITAAPLAFLALAAPLLWGKHAVAAWALTQFFSFACHQDPARSFWIAGAPVAVCARCLGIYAGAAAGAWFRMSRARALRFVAAAALLNALDVLAEAVHLHGNWMLPRFALGWALGAALASVVAGSGIKPQAGNGSRRGNFCHPEGLQSNGGIAPGPSGLAL